MILNKIEKQVLKEWIAVPSEDASTICPATIAVRSGPGSHVVRYPWTCQRCADLFPEMEMKIDRPDRGWVIRECPCEFFDNVGFVKARARLARDGEL